MGRNTVAQNRQLIIEAAQRYGLDVAIALAQIQQESSFDDQARSPAGALGLAQMMPATAASLGIDPLDATQSADGWGRLMSQYLAQFGGDYVRALISYHSGPGAVEGVLRNPAGNPNSTHYYKTILANAGSYQAAPADSPVVDDGGPEPEGSELTWVLLAIAGGFAVWKLFLSK